MSVVMLGKPYKTKKKKKTENHSSTDVVNGWLGSVSETELTVVRMTINSETGLFFWKGGSGELLKLRLR